MMITIESIEPTDEGKSRVYYTIDNSELKSLLMQSTNMNSIATFRHAIKESLKGLEYVEDSFEL